MSEGFAVSEKAAPLPPPPELADRIARWKSELLDTSGHNRMLFFKDTRQTLKLPIGEATTWDALVEADGVSLAGATASDENEEDDEDQGGATSVQPRWQDEEAVLKTVRKLADTNRTFAEEQGVHVLHACFGWLTWVDESRAPGPRDSVVELPTGRKARLVRSPLLFVPVVVDKSGQHQKLVREQNVPIEPNITLLHYMRHQFAVAPDIDEDDDLEPLAVVAAWKSAIAGKAHWSASLDDETRVDVFSFKKIALFRELERSIEQVSEQTVLRALCGDAEPLIAASSIPHIRSLDTEVAPVDLVTVVPADSSQVKALLAVKSGSSLVIQGPPGTGKSQTITNLIADAIACGKKVLFVAEKRAARDVVVGNLEEAGLGDIVLHITEEVSASRGGAGAKKDIADQLERILRAGPQNYPAQPHVAERVGEIRAGLNEYVEHLHTPLSIEPWTSPYRLLERWALAGGELPPAEVPELPSVRSVDEAWLERALDVASALDDLGEPVLSRVSHVWLDTPVRDWDAAAASRLLAALALLRDSSARVEEIVGTRKLPYSSGARTVSLAQSVASDLRELARFQALRFSAHRWFAPRYWSLRRAENRWVVAGGEPFRGDEEESAAQLDDLAQSVVRAHELVRQRVPEFSSSGEFAILSAAAAPLLCGLDELEASTAVGNGVARATPALRSVLIHLVKHRPVGASVRAMLETALRYHWAVEAASSHPALRVESPSRERLRKRFVEADRLLRTNGVAATLNAVAPRRPGLDSVAPKDSELGILRQQIGAKRRKPLRWLFSRTANTILQLKPCVVSSPLGVAQFLHHPSYRFDLVVFDEASQIPTADAVVPMAKAKQVVVVGDSQQMPPTAFFDRTLGQQDPDDSAVGFESVLQESGSLLPGKRLLWHYRSRDERLIAFSNYLFYDGSLLTFPASWAEHPDRGVRFVHVADAVYGKGGSRSNPMEAERVIDLLVHELRTAPERDVAVTAMSVQQASEIQNRLEHRLAADPDLQRWADLGNRVKNLETIQGDECDVMILSFGYGRDAGGSAVLNFGPLSRDDGYRRLNVAVTRAREKTILVSSLRASDIPPTVGSGGQLVRRYLDYAERGPLALVENLRAAGVDQFDSGFEEAVARQLRARGWSVDTQVGVSKFRIDLGIRDPEHPGRYLAGVECDGATYHGAESARDRDIARQEVLEKLGWRIFRIWSPEWFANSGAVLEALERFLREDEPRPGKQSAVNGQEPEPLQPPNPGAALIPDEFDSRLPPGTEEYFPHSPSEPTMPLDQWIATVVAKEGPLHEDELLLAVRDDLGYGRMGHVLRSEWMAEIDRAVRSKTVVRRGLWLWPPGMDVAAVPVWVVLDEPRRKFEWYSDEELLRAMQITCSVAGSLPVDTLAAATARLLGFKATAAVLARLQSLVPVAITQGRVKEEGPVVTAA